MSNDCRDFRGLAAAAALGALEGAEMERFQQHLAACPSCHSEFERSRRTLELAGAAASAAPVPEDLPGRILAAGREQLLRESRGAPRRRRLAALVGAAAALLLAAGLAWQALRPEPEGTCGCWQSVDGDPGNSRQVELDADLVPDHIAWEQQLNGLPGSFKPLAWKGLVVVGAMPAGRASRQAGGGRLVAFGARDGQVRWARDFPAGDFSKGKSFPDRCIAGGRIYVTDGAGCLVLDAATGRDLGRLDPPAPARGWSYLAASGGRLVGAAGDGRTLFSVDPGSGRAFWTRELESEVFVPALAEGRVCFATGAGELAALDARTGAPLWRRPQAVPAGRVSVHARGAFVLAVARNDEVLAFDAESGRPAWRHREAGAFASGVAFGPDAVFLLGGTMALRLADGGMLWHQTGATGSICAAPTVAGGKVLATAGPGASAGSLKALDGGSGQQLAALADAARRSCDGVIVAGGRLFTIADGRLLAVACRGRS